MSWQAYVDQSLVGTGNIDKAIICDASGKTIWAATTGFSIPEAERKVIVDSFTDSAETKAVVANGIHINGEKYITLDSDDTSLKAKKGKEGIIVIKTTQALLIGHHPADVQTTVAYSSVAELAEYLVKVGY
ncbi:Profilin/allergen [Mytilinidion resinicola]|uniref:Profilin n=1 Tax=Mytilinidion resinicola TaxID=574789 RepID=A0A6A6YYN2_9PEZI|nr:Profilin/allergen [Mytilinidion resinicola]KAF2813870.1 Profilin/allergen [Mytilinidion resinicola]